ncbi:Palmitoyltransferase [Podosphaera aphanis]|nr:Palmitoyltransferase [Podosphaera aphanis]
MSFPEPKNALTAPNAPTTPNGKASVVAPVLSDGDQVELSEILPAGPETPFEDDIMHLARLGDVPSIQRLFQNEKFNPSYCDSEGITPLHWAAINNQYVMCKFLLKEGADVNKKGGDSVATPAMWAAQRCHYYTVHLLLQNGADPLITDVQGYNILHLATFEGNIFLLLLLLHQGIDVDAPDTQGHTCLMWAAYKGFPACVDLFLRWGANVHATDESGFTALHWALVKGSQGCIQKLIEYGADRFSETSTGKTPAITAEEMKTEHIWHRALKECGYNENGNPSSLKFPFSNIFLKDKRSFMNKFFFLFPFFIVWIMIMILSHLVVFLSIPFALITGYGLQTIAQKLIKYAPSDMKHLHLTPWLAGIFSGTLFLVGLNWITTLLPTTYDTHIFENFLFGTSYLLCAYFYSCTMIYEPGFIPKPGLTQQKAVIDELLSVWKFDEQNFCIHCLVRKPLRSKHCKQCNRCVAKHDHHCPWVFNCVGANNHRHFLLYLFSLEIGIFLSVRIAIGYFEIKVADGISNSCNTLTPSLCQVVNSDPYTLILTIWSTLQLTWVTMLMFVQLVQISRAVTTWENMRGSHHENSSKASEAIMSALATGGATDNNFGRQTACPKARHHHHKKGCFAMWKKLLGIDTFVETALHGKDIQRNRNSFSAGCLTNCRDFWCDPAPIFGKRKTGSALLRGKAVDYTSLYTIPRITSHLTRAGETVYESVETDDGNF